jgi:filamentous hemagglutinin family protein
MALAGPTGGQVVAGSGTIQRPSADTTLIQQQSQSLSIDWTGFDVAGHELVKFQQPSSSSAVLNRVFNELPSQIYGRIQANGQVFIMNPNGVVFGPGARVEVGGLMASSIDIDVEDFMNGHYRFAAPEGSVPGAVINSGLIRAATGGGVALLGGAVRNDGVIIADLGHVLMGAGRQALVDFDGDGLIRFHVDGAILERDYRPGDQQHGHYSRRQHRSFPRSSETVGARRRHRKLGHHRRVGIATGGCRLGGAHIRRRRPATGTHPCRRRGW